MGRDGVRQIPFDIALQQRHHSLHKTLNGLSGQGAKDSSSVGEIKLVELVVMRRPRVGRKALAWRMGEPMNNSRRKKAEQILRSRRRMSSNNSSRVWELWWRLFVESLLTLADDGRRA